MYRNLLDRLWVGIPHVRTASSDPIEILSEYGYSLSDARRLVNQGSIKVEDTKRKRHSVCKIPDEFFTVVEPSKVACTILWIGKRTPLLIVDDF